MNQPKHITPPKWPLRFLRFFVKKEYLEEVEGDMEEVFQENLERHSEKKARRLYVWEMLKLLRPIIMKSIAVNSRIRIAGIIGSDVMRRHDFVINYKTRNITFTGH